MDTAVSMINFEHRFQFQLAYGTEMTAESDPIAMAFKVGSIGHMKAMIDVATATLSPGDRVLDLGAHLGGFMLSMAALGFEVLGVEASPRCVDLVEQSLALNNFASAHIEHACVTDRPGIVKFSACGPFGHVACPATRMPWVSVPAVTVDDLVRERGWNNVRFVKLRVQGSEIHALRGMTTLLRTQSPLVFFESNRTTLAWYQFTPDELAAELHRHGYTIYTIEPGKLVRVPRGAALSETIADYFAAKTLPASLQAWDKSPPLPIRERLGRSFERSFGRVAQLALRLARLPAEAPVGIYGKR